MQKIQYYKNDPNYGWKLHLAFYPEQAQYVERFLETFKNAYGVLYKMGRNSGQSGKDATVYCGSKKNAEKIAELIYLYIGKYLLHPMGDALHDDVFFNPKVAGRFTVGHNYVAGGNIKPPSKIDDFADREFEGWIFHQYGAKGIPFLDKHMRQIVFDKSLDKNEWRKKSFEESDKLLKKDFGEYYTGRKKQKTKLRVKRKIKKCRCK